MPEINLLTDTKQPEEPVKKPLPPSGQIPMSDPEIPEGKGVGDLFRSLFNRHPKPSPISAAPPPIGQMSVNRRTRDERILKETRKAPTNMIPLPEEEGGLDVNLLTEDVVTRLNPRQKLIQLGLVAVGAAALIGLLFFALTFIEKNITDQIKAARTKLQTIETEMTALEPIQADIQSTTKKLGAIKNLIDQHTRWSKFFTQLERYTLSSVSYGTAFSANVSGAISLSAKTESYLDVAKQYLILRQAVENGDFISGFTISGATKMVTPQGTITSFSISMQILPTVLENIPLATTLNPTTNPILSP